MLNYYDTITALATPNGIGALALIRISGFKTFSIVDQICKLKNKNKLKDLTTNTLKMGVIFDHKKILDQVLVYIYKMPNSYTGEDLIEISCHGSFYIVNSILQLLVNKGARIANPGEFTLRAFINGKMDLSQSESVSDLIYSESYFEHRLAMTQIKGVIYNKINILYQKFLYFYSFIEVNINFAEEMELDNSKLLELIKDIENDLLELINSFYLGNYITKGISVALVGSPNVGKSTLLNTILQENRSIVSDIPGTTRDVIEDSAVINGIRFRFLDTAGIRETKNKIEILGLEKTFESIKKSNVICYIFDSTNFKKENIINKIKNLKNHYPDKIIFILANKSDMTTNHIYFQEKLPGYFLNISAKKRNGIDNLINRLSNPIQHDILNNNIILTNVRHYELFKKVLKFVKNIYKGLKQGKSESLFYLEIKTIFLCLEEITGKRHSEELLNNIFSTFCIGK